MAIKIQVKDGFDVTTNAGIGVTPVTNTVDGICTITNNCGYSTGYNYYTTGLAGMSNGATMSPMQGWSTSVGQRNHLAAQSAMANAKLNDLVAKVAMFDSILATRIGGIGAQCIATANRIARIATFDVELARNLSRLALVDFPAASGLSNLGLVNPMAASMQVDRLVANRGLNEVAVLSGTAGVNTSAHQASLATVCDEGNVYRIVIRIPGVVSDAVDVLVSNGKLVITVKAQAGLSTIGNQSLWTQAFSIGQDVCIDAIEAIVSNDVLTVNLPKAVAMNSVSGNVAATRMSEVAVC